MNFSKKALYAALGLALDGCASAPVGPNVAVMPGPGKPFDQFQLDNAECMAFACQQMGVNPNEVARGEALTGAGLIVGSAAGANAANLSAMTLRRRYDIALAVHACQG